MTALQDIKEQRTGLFAATWNVPTRNGQALAITPKLPASLELLGSRPAQDQVPLALLMFNIGVEIGQLLF